MTQMRERGSLNQVLIFLYIIYYLPRKNYQACGNNNASIDYATKKT